MLAIEVVFAGADPVPTYRVRRGRRRGRRQGGGARSAGGWPGWPGPQVVVVTHLPQVAAFADTHLVVEKSPDDGSGHRAPTCTPSRGGPGARAVPDALRAGRLRVGQAHARELLAVAARARG